MGPVPPVQRRGGGEGDEHEDVPPEEEDGRQAARAPEDGEGEADEEQAQHHDDEMLLTFIDAFPLLVPEQPVAQGRAGRYRQGWSTTVCDSMCSKFECNIFACRSVPISRFGCAGNFSLSMIDTYIHVFIIEGRV